MRLTLTLYVDAFALTHLFTFTYSQTHTCIRIISYIHAFANSHMHSPPASFRTRVLMNLMEWTLMQMLRLLCHIWWSWYRFVGDSSWICCEWASLRAGGRKMVDWISDGKKIKGVADRRRRNEEKREDSALAGWQRPWIGGFAGHACMNASAHTYVRLLCILGTYVSFYINGLSRGPRWGAPGDEIRPPAAARLLLLLLLLRKHFRHARRASNYDVQKLRSAISKGLCSLLCQHVTVSSEVPLVVTVGNYGGGNDRDNGARGDRKREPRGS